MSLKKKEVNDLNNSSQNQKQEGQEENQINSSAIYRVEEILEIVYNEYNISPDDNYVMTGFNEGKNGAKITLENSDYVLSVTVKN